MTAPTRYGPGPPLRADPRISTAPPGWFDRPDWRQPVEAMTDEDLGWLADQWESADGPAHPTATSWTRTDGLGTAVLLVLLTAVLAVLTAIAIAVGVSP